MVGSARRREKGGVCWSEREVGKGGARCWAEKKEVGRGAGGGENKRRGRGELGREGQGESWAGRGFSPLFFSIFLFCFPKPL